MQSSRTRSRVCRLLGSRWIQPVRMTAPLAAQPPGSGEQRPAPLVVGAAVPGGAEHRAARDLVASWRTACSGSARAATVVASEIAARHGGRARRHPARRRPAGDRRPAKSIDVDDVVRRCTQPAGPAAALHDRAAARRGSSSTSSVAPIPSSPRGLYFVLAAVGIFSLLVGASVRLRRPDHQATLHFFWLTVAFFGVLAFSFTGRLDHARLDLLLGRPRPRSCCCRRCSCTSRWSSRSGPTLGAQRRRAHAAAADLPAGAAARRARRWRR